MSASHKNLNQYFEAAKAQEPEVSLSELKETISRLPAGNSMEGKTSAGVGSKTALWTLSGMGVFFITVLFFLSLSENTPKTTQTQTNATVASGQRHAVSKGANLQTQGNASAAVRKEIGFSEQAITQNPSATSGATSLQAKATPDQKATKTELMVASAEARVAKEGEKVFGNITLLELPRQVEEKLGIQTNDRGILYERILQDPAEGAIRLQFSIYGGSHSVSIGPPAVVQIGNDFPFKFGTDSSKLLVPVTSFFPVYISNRKGERRVMYSTDSEDKRKFEPEYFNEIVNTLIPVLVRANNKAKDEAIFWFAATPDFLRLLPQALNQEIAREYKQLAQQKEQASDSSRISTSRLTRTQLKYFESNSGSLSSIQYAVVFPNPTAEWLNLSMSLKREEEMRVSLVDINGKLVRTLSPFKRYAAGTVTEKFSIKDEARGLYLLLTETKSGHQHTQRIIIE